MDLNLGVKLKIRERLKTEILFAGQASNDCFGELLRLQVGYRFRELTFP